MCLLLILLLLIPSCEPLRNISGCTLYTCKPIVDVNGPVMKSSQKPSYYKEGDFLLGGVVQLHLLILGEGQTCGLPASHLLRHAMAMIYAIEEINKNPKILPNISLGYQIHDSCTSQMKALQGTLGILSKRTEPVPNYSCQRKDTLIGFIGDFSSATSYAMAQLLGIYKYPQISFGALDPVFSDKLIYPSFYRTVPNELSQYAGIARLLEQFHWSWVGIITSDDASGESALRELRKEITLTGGCVAFSYMIPTHFTPFAIEGIVEAMKKHTSQVVIVHSTGTGMAQYFLHYSWRKLPTKIWVSSVSMPFITENGFGEVLRLLNGTLAFSLRRGEITGFKDFLHDVSPAVFPDDEALKMLWQFKFNCKLKGGMLKKNPYIASLPICLGNETFRTQNMPDYDVNNFRFTYSMYSAVYALAYALNAVLSLSPALGIDMNAGSLKEDLMPWKLNKYLRNIHFKTPDGAVFAFDGTGDVVPQFDILNWVYLPNRTIISIPVGHFDPLAPEGHQLLINISSILWPPKWFNNKKFPYQYYTTTVSPNHQRIRPPAPMTRKLTTLANACLFLSLFKELGNK